jgi:predicted small lipoprotein YifL
MNTHHLPKKALVLLLISSFALGSCGIKGSLQTPPPLWGKQAPQADTDSENIPNSDKVDAQKEETEG